MNKKAAWAPRVELDRGRRKVREVRRWGHRYLSDSFSRAVSQPRPYEISLQSSDPSFSSTPQCHYWLFVGQDGFPAGSEPKGVPEARRGAGMF